MIVSTKWDNRFAQPPKSPLDIYPRTSTRRPEFGSAGLLGQIPLKARCQLFLRILMLRRAGPRIPRAPHQNRAGRNSRRIEMASTLVDCQLCIAISALVQKGDYLSIPTNCCCALFFTSLRGFVSSCSQLRDPGVYRPRREELYKFSGHLLALFLADTTYLSSKKRQLPDIFHIARSYTRAYCNSPVKFHPNLIGRPAKADLSWNEKGLHIEDLYL